MASETRRCSGCNGTSFHYSRQRNTIICDVCGRPLSNMAELETEQRYYSDRSMAIRHIKAGDYNSAKQYLEKMRLTRPDDPDIYYLHLMGLTGMCKDYILDQGDARLKQAEEYFRKLQMLHGDTTRFVSYGRIRRQMLKEYWENIYNQLLTKLLIIGAICFVAILLCFSVSAGFILVLVAAVVILCSKNIPRDLIASSKAKKRLLRGNSNSPFT